MSLGEPIDCGSVWWRVSTERKGQLVIITWRSISSLLSSKNLGIKKVLLIPLDGILVHRTFLPPPLLTPPLPPYIQHSLRIVIAMGFVTSNHGLRGILFIPTVGNSDTFRSLGSIMSDSALVLVWKINNSKNQQKNVVKKLPYFCTDYPGFKGG